MDFQQPATVQSTNRETLYVKSVLTAILSNIAIQHYLRYLVDDLLF